MKKIISLSIVCLSSLVFGHAYSAEKIHVVASIPALASLAEEVGGSKVEVQSLSKGTMDPHFVEPKPSLVMALNKADLLIHVGLELEIGWLPPLLLNSRNLKIRTGETGNFESSSVIQILEIPNVKVDRSMGDIHPRGNPHFWMTPKNGLAIAHGIAERLKKLSPTDSAVFDQNLSIFSAKLSEVEKSLEPQIQKLKGLKVVPYHNSFPYVSNWLGLKEINYIEKKPGIPPDPQHLSLLVSEMKREGVKVILLETFYNRSIAESVARQSEAKIIDMATNVGESPEIQSYFDLVKSEVNTLVNAAGV